MHKLINNINLSIIIIAIANFLMIRYIKRFLDISIMQEMKINKFCYRLAIVLCVVSCMTLIYNIISIITLLYMNGP